MKPDMPKTENGTTRPGFWRVLGALVGSAVVGALALAVLFTALKLSNEGHSMQGWATGLVLYGLVSLLFALPTTVLLGGPIYWLFSRRGRLIRGALVVSAGLLASVPFSLFAREGWAPGENLQGELQLAAVLFAAGCLAGATFWKLAGLRKPAE